MLGVTEALGVAETFGFVEADGLALAEGEVVGLAEINPEAVAGPICMNARIAIPIAEFTNVRFM